jgi:hypothetical protein
MLKLSQVFKYMTKLALNKKELQDLIAFRKLDDISDPKYLADQSLIPSNKPLMHNPKDMTRELLTRGEPTYNALINRVQDIYSSGFQDHKLFKNKIAPKLISQGKDPGKVLEAVRAFALGAMKSDLPYMEDDLSKDQIENRAEKARSDAGNTSYGVTNLRALLRQRGIEIQEGRPGADLELYKDLEKVMGDVSKQSPFMYVGQGFREHGELGKRIGQEVVLNRAQPLVSNYRPNIDNILRNSDDLSSTMDMFTNVNKLHEFSESQSKELARDEISGNDLVNYIVKNPGSLYSTLSSTGGHKGQQPIEDLALIANLTGPGSEAARKAMAQLRREDIAGMQAILKLTNKDNLRTNLMLNHATLDPSLVDSNNLTNESANFNNVLGKYFANDISSNKQFNEKLKQLAISKGLIGAEGSLSDIAAGSTLADSIKAKIKPETLKGVLESMGPTRMSSEARNILYKNLDLAAASDRMQSSNIAGIPEALKPFLINQNKENPASNDTVGTALGLLVPADDQRLWRTKNYLKQMPISTPSPDVSKGEVITNAIKDSLKAAPLEPLKRSISKL